MTKVLVIDDNADFRKVLISALTGAGYDVSEEAGGRTGLAAARVGDPDVILLDLAMPDVDGMQVLDDLRNQGPLPAVIILSARHHESDVALALGRGADDYITKPFSPVELLARVASAARRGAALEAKRQSTPVTWGALAIDLAGHQVAQEGKPVDLTKSEFDLLAALINAPDQVLTRRQLLDRTRGADWMGDEHSVDIHISRLRSKLAAAGAEPGVIQTVRGVGFRMARPPGHTDPGPPRTGAST